MKSVIVVGAGIIGLYCAAQLVRRGARVTLLEAEADDFGGHGPAASLAAAGMLAPLSETRHAHEGHALAQELGLASYDLWRTHARDALWSDGVRFDGAAFVARDANEAELMRATASTAKRSAEILAPKAFYARTGLDARADHALFFEDEAVADPERVLSGLAMELRRHGALLRFNADVESADATSVTLHGGEKLEADFVLLAPGAWANRGLISAAPELGLIHPAQGALVPVRTAEPLKSNVRAPDFYLARRREDDVVLGASLHLDDYSRVAKKDDVAILTDAAAAFAPGQVAPREDERPWAGVRPISPDWAPLIGPSQTGVLLGAGHSRNGWLLAPITAEIISAYVFGETVTPLWAAFHPNRFEIS